MAGNYLIFSVVLFISIYLVNSHSHNWRWSPRHTSPEYSQIKVYLFNVTNPEETIKGSKPILEEVGPYVYREKKVRFNISTTSMATVKYQENKTYHFVPELSKGREDDQISFVNIPLVSALSTLLNVPIFGLGFVDKLLKSTEQFVRQDVHAGDLFYKGIDVQLYISILETLGQAVPPQMEGGKFGMFKGKNGTDEGVFEVQEKVDYLHNVAELVSWKNLTYLTTWNQKQCNRIQGSSGDAFPPGIGKTTILYWFNPEMCRSFPLVYQRDEVFKGIPAYRFVFPESMLEYAKINEENTCYCRGYDPDDFDQDFTSCLKKGAIDLTLCRKAPLASSFPHFLDADPSYLELVQGLNPDRKAHESFLVVEPKTGTVLDFHMRFQLNVQTAALARISAMKRIPRYLFPVMWGDKSFTMDDETTAELLKSYDHINEISSSVSDDSANSNSKDISSIFIALPVQVMIILSIVVARVL